MKINRIHGTIVGFFLLTFSASSSSVPLVTGAYNFQLAGGGGGSQATLNGIAVEIFCDDFANEIWDPSSNSANVTTLGSGANLDATRFGDVASWTTIALPDPTDQTFLNGAAGSASSARYAMVAYLVSQYNLGQGNNTSNNQIQEAIWTLMDPAAYGTTTPLIDPSGFGEPIADLEAAANWYLAGNATDSFLAQFEVVSDATMTPGSPSSGGVGVGGFQEQIVFTPAPEPRGGIWMLIGLFGVAGFLLQRARARKLAPVAQVFSVHRAS
jgi:hypothetical protein